jgi:hypothetical protein
MDKTKRKIILTISSDKPGSHPRQRRRLEGSTMDGKLPARGTDNTRIQRKDESLQNAVIIVKIPSNYSYNN